MIEKAALLLLGKGAEVVGNAIVSHLPEEANNRITEITHNVTDAIGLTAHSNEPQPIDARYSDFSAQPLSRIYTNNQLQLSQANLRNANLQCSYCNEFTNISGLDVKEARMDGAILLLAYVVEAEQRVFGRPAIEPLLPLRHNAILTLKDCHNRLNHYLQAKPLEGTELHHAGTIIATGYYFIQSKLNLKLDCSPQEFQKDMELFRLINRKLITKYPELTAYKQNFRNYIDPLPLVQKFHDITIIDDDYMGTEEERELHRTIQTHRKQEWSLQKRINSETSKFQTLRLQDKLKTLRMLQPSDMEQSLVATESQCMSMMDVSVIDMQGSAILPPEQLEIQKIIAALAKEREQTCQKTTRLQEQLQEIIRKKLESRNGISSDQKQSGLAL